MGGARGSIIHTARGRYYPIRIHTYNTYSTRAAYGPCTVKTMRQLSGTDRPYKPD